MGRAPRARPRRLPQKLAAIREALGVSCEVMVGKLRALMPPDNMPRIHPQNISGYQQGEREPALLTLLAYARLARVPVETLIDDALKLPRRLPRAVASDDRGLDQ